MNYRARERNEIHDRLRTYGANEIQADASKFLRAHMFTERLRKYVHKLTMQEYHDIREQALNGDVKGASDKLEDILRNKTW